MPDLALSTMWGIGKFDTLAEFFTAAAALGFDRIELNHGVDSSMLRGVNLDGFKITSVHEPCPADVSAATLRQRDWLVSALREEDRQRGMNAIRRSIDLAHELGAHAVIVHPGRVDMDPMLEGRLAQLYRDGKTGTPEYARAKEELVAARAAQAPANLDAVRTSLKELAEYAGQQQIRLGLENRYHYHEIPSPDELAYLLDSGSQEVVGFWYDVGHAHTLDQLGLYRHSEWLERFASRILGVHLHDVVGLSDHQSAGAGQVDWGMVTRYLPAQALRTCEFHNRNSRDQVQAGLAWLIKQGIVM